MFLQCRSHTTCVAVISWAQLLCFTLWDVIDLLNNLLIYLMQMQISTCHATPRWARLLSPQSNYVNACHKVVRTKKGQK